MNITQAHIEFRQSLDRADSSAYPDLLAEQVDYFLNEAYNRYIKTSSKRRHRNIRVCHT